MSRRNKLWSVKGKTIQIHVTFAESAEEAGAKITEAFNGNFEIVSVKEEIESVESVSS